MPHDLRFIKGRKSLENLAGLVPYVGGKRKQVDELLKMIGHPAKQNLVYVEAFVGAGSVLLNAIKRGLVDWIWLNDKDPATCAMWNAILHHPDLLRDEVARRSFTSAGGLTTLDEAAVKESVRISQAAQPGARMMELVELAYHAMIAHRCTWGGVVRNGEPVPVGQEELNKRWTLDKVSFDIDQAHYLLGQCAIWHGECTCLDAIDLVKQVPVESVLFLDPPYYRRGGENYIHGLGPEQHKALAAALLNSTVPWLLTYDDCEEVRTLYGIPQHPPVRKNVRRPPASDIGEEESLALKEQIESDVHQFHRPEHQKYKNVVEQQKGWALAQSAMVMYTMSGKHTWKPDLRIQWAPEWFVRANRSQEDTRVMYDETGKGHRVPAKGMKSKEAELADTLKLFESYEAKWAQAAAAGREEAPMPDTDPVS
jgi:DNA adenine methylase